MGRGTIHYFSVILAIIASLLRTELTWTTLPIFTEAALWEHEYVDFAKWQSP